ncbi:hypothetical protein DACRYDRAFT_118662 [Dacryopinax primogenitus]|uniref:Transmembrane protein 188 n=1 Tax=Dacryopinax primogenitus (strain DJM 731) TaxID=1858805 RepID=M5FXV8_DACPD|nr:uncharacterized protein DACRYDRAFT_118662 [Dacryopinax primogenitus]EJT98376.1 hypothetical protein DACRYDRAFT_118662 [Dacryopinax primogenitus]
MPPRAKPASYYPPADHATFKDLLRFEERLKTNNARLKKQKARYQFFLLVLLIYISLLTSDVLFNTFFTSYPINFALKAEHPLWEPIWIPHPYVTPGLLLIACTTLVLFFASGTYAEKIGYANRYVPSANRALRSFNLYFNIRSPSIFPYPLSLLFQSPPHPPHPPTQSAPSPPHHASRSALQPLPPASNPRGELIFSARVSPTFKDAYEAHRAGFERMRAKKRQPNKWWALSWVSGTGAGAGKEAEHEEHEGEKRGERRRSVSLESSLAPTPNSSRLPSRSPSPVMDVANDGELRPDTERVPGMIPVRRRSARIASKLEGLEKEP